MYSDRDHKTLPNMLKRQAVNTTSRMASAKVTLANVLSGDTCYPINLNAFEAYLTYKEHSLENLQFIVWYHNYRSRFLALPGEAQTSGSRHREPISLPSAAKTAQRVVDSKHRVEKFRCSQGVSQASPPAQLIECPTASSTVFSLQSNTESALRSPLLERDHKVHAGLQAVPLAEQPFRADCSRIVATFLTPGAAKELPLDPAVRDTAIRNLTWSTHPDVFLPVYEEIYDILSTISLPRFLGCASTNINRPKQFFWYGMGFLDTLLGVALAIIFVTLVHGRAWRLFAIPIAVIGIMQVYSAWRGFCSQVWGRRSIQVRPWEMQEMDEEAMDHWARILDVKGTGDKTDVQMSERVARKENSDAIAPFAMDELLSPATAPTPQPVQQSGTRKICRLCPLNRLVPDGHASTSSTVVHGWPTTDGNTHKRPTVFGPEKAVLDPRIQAIHRRIMQEVLLVGFCSTLAFTALILAVPGRL
ncbi:hypothetical protein WOLCODRAFT_99298 [Wolfiporia cocos MD-104 SS10]|uniref:RGS domain-containing protein n=1 Tax=Wolfiporia cocos (strain MD-104) TaxID=742152 RepID=A0A2H3JGW6_WOLCO|nr:hypothetical protein WOLCODRAFT_99298 [Wolfiporia cocos MD-104 SS10]